MKKLKTEDVYQFTNKGFSIVMALSESLGVPPKWKGKRRARIMRGGR